MHAEYIKANLVLLFSRKPTLPCRCTAQELGERLEEGASVARDAAMTTVQHRRKLHWAEYRATCARNGCYEARRQGEIRVVCNLNEELLRPIQSCIAVSWNAAFGTTAEEAIQ